MESDSSSTQQQHDAAETKDDGRFNLNEEQPAVSTEQPGQPRTQLTGESLLKRRQHLEHHIRSNPTDIQSYRELAQIYRDTNKPIDAKRVLGQAVDLFPDDNELRWELEEATLARSLQQLREVGELAAKLNTAETGRELQRCQQDWARRRIDVCQARLARDPSLLQLRVSLGEALHDAEQYENAFDELGPLLVEDEYSAAARLLRGKCLLALGRELEAMAELRGCALRRAVTPPIRTKIMALRLLCETAERLGVSLTLESYQKHLRVAEDELAKTTSTNGTLP